MTDTNDDAHVDVIDVQNVSAALLAETPQAGADVNHDGRVDILDLQCVVNRATGVTATHDETSSSQPSAPVPTPSPSDHLIGIRQAHFARQDQPVHRAPAASLDASIAGLGHQDELHRLGLSPHAPPAC